MGVGDDFLRFKDALTIPSEKANSISYRYKRITRQLNKDLWSWDSESAHSIYVGSYGRDTAAKGISDLDVAFTLPPLLYSQYSLYIGNGQSALLQLVKRSVQNTYRTSDAFGDGQVVVVNFDDGVRFEILPIFENNVPGNTNCTYPNANAGGSWKACNPRAEMQAMKARNDATKGNLRYLCRMLRIWKDLCDVPMSGMLIDTLVYQFMESYEHRDKGFTYYDWMLRDLFRSLWLQNETQTFWRAPGSGSYVWRKGIFENKARSAMLRAEEAVEADTKGQTYTRRQKWRQVFGSLYPDAD